MTANNPRQGPIDKVSYGLIRQFFNLLGLASKSTAERLSTLLGHLVFRLAGRHRRIALDNLLRAFGGEITPGQAREITRRVFVNLVRILFEIGWLLRLDPRDARRQIRLDGWDRLTRQLRRGKGALVLLAHAGNWELLSAMVLFAPTPVNVLYRPLDYKPLDRFFRDLRSRFGATPISTRRSAREVIRALKRGEVVGILMDQNVDWYEGVFVEFFGRRAATNKGFALLALKTGAPVLPAYLIREAQGYRVAIWPEIPLIRTGDRTKDIEANTQQYNDAIERFVRRHPDQWFWVHQRWKTRPYQPWPRQ